jgi:hypothetical protein
VRQASARPSMLPVHRSIRRQSDRWFGGGSAALQEILARKIDHIEPGPNGQ